MIKTNLLHKSASSCLKILITLRATLSNNGTAFVLSSIHKPDQSIEWVFRRPRKTLKNSSHVEKVWEDNRKSKIHILHLIYDYNHWMGGVDLQDQHVGYYNPNLDCRRIWIPYQCLFSYFQ